MNITSITSYLVYPGKNQDHPLEVQSTTIPLIGSLYIMLSELFFRSERECQIPTRFVMSEDGKQEKNLGTINWNLYYEDKDKLIMHMADDIMKRFENKTLISVTFSEMDGDIFCAIEHGNLFYSSAIRVVTKVSHI